MTDIDFDELDKAVNSVMSGSSADNTVAQNPLNVDQNSPTENNLVAPTQPAVANPRTGRFMDVVPPNANPRVNISVPDRTVSRQGNDIVPVAGAANEAPVTTLDDVPTLTQPEPVVATDLPMVTSEQSVDKVLQENMQTNQPENDSESDDSDIDQISNDIDKTLAGASDQPIDTPFLADAKVDKRPLGAFSEETTTNVDATEQQAVSQPEQTLPVEAETPTPVMPNVPEQTSQAQPEAVSSAPAMSVQPEITAPVTSNEVQNIENQPVAATADTRDSQPVGVTSINQQYQEQPSSGDKTNGSIYDTDAYHKAVLKPAKKKSGWLMVLWIFLLLVVGAGSGVAVYFFVLPNL